MEKEIEKLLNYLCSEWGFCIPANDTAEIKQCKELKADQFACAVLKAENMNIETEIEWRRKIRNKFKETFGEEISIGDY